MCSGRTRQAASWAWTNALQGSRPQASATATPSAQATPTVVANLAMVAHAGGMGEAAASDDEAPALGVEEARDRFSDLVGRAAAAGTITRISRGRTHRTVAAIVPVDVLEAYEEMLDREDARIANERLADLDAGREVAVPAAQVWAELGL